MSSASTAALTCLGLTFLNPHVYLDTVVLLGAIGAQQGPDGRWWFGAGAISASILWFTALGFGSRRLSGVLSRPGAWRVLDGGIAVIMATMAVLLVR